MINFEVIKNISRCLTSQTLEFEIHMYLDAS